MLDLGDNIRSIAEDPLIEELRLALNLVSNDDLPDIYVGGSIRKYMAYWLYFTILVISPLSRYLPQNNWILLSLLATVILLLDFISVIRVDSRVMEVQKSIVKDRTRSLKFAYFQLLITQIFSVVVVLTAGFLLENVVTIQFFQTSVNPYFLVGSIVVTYLYIFALNTAPINWYITGQPFWIQTKDVLILPLSRSKKQLALARYGLWLLAIGLYFIPSTSTFAICYGLFVAMIIWLMPRYIRRDIRHITVLSLKIHTRLSSSIPLAVKEKTLPSSVEEVFDRPISQNIDYREDSYGYQYDRPSMNRSHVVDNLESGTLKSLIREVIEKKERSRR